MLIIEMKIELFPNTIETYMTWEEANAFCIELGHGWRLPTKDELIYIFNHNGDRFGNYGCWGDNFNSEYSWSLGFKTGNLYLNPTNNVNYIIPVKDL